MNRGLTPDQKEEIVLSYNKLSMEQLQKDNFDNSMTYLKQALIAIKPITEEKIKQKMMAITFNNLGCFFKRTKNFSEALKYLEKSVEFQNKLPNESATIAGAYLNMCSIYSQLNDHGKALHCGLKAIFLLKTVPSEQSKHVPTLIVAYHNVASEYRMLGQTENAEECLKTALEISKNNLNPNHNIISGISYNLAKLHKRVKTPNAEYYSKIPSSRGQLRGYNRTKSRAGSNELRKKMNFEGFWTEKKIVRKKSNPRRMIFRIPHEVELQQPFVTNMFNGNGNEEEEILERSQKSVSGISSVARRLDVSLIREAERFAAVRIQSWWRGCTQRIRFEESKVESKVKKAENKARKAVEEFEKIKLYADKLKTKHGRRVLDRLVNK